MRHDHGLILLTLQSCMLNTLNFLLFCHLDSFILNEDASYKYFGYLSSTLYHFGSNGEGNRQEGQGSPNGGNRLQVPDIFLSLKRQEETN